MSAERPIFARPLRIFIIHASSLITDSDAHGDGLLAYRSITELAARGHHLSVACERVLLERPVPPNVELFPIPLRATHPLLRQLEYARKMRALFNRLDRTRRFDVAHQLNPVYAGISLGLAGSGVPIVLGPYVRDWTHDRSAPKKLVRRGLCAVQQALAQAVILSGHAASERIVVPSTTTPARHTIPFGIDTAVFAQQPMPAGDPVVLYLAALTRRKGIFVLLEAFQQVAQVLPHARLIIAGDGADEAAAHAAAKRSRHGDRIEFLGRVSRDAVPALLASATVVCSPSNGEPYGMPIVEAMAVGRPIVATRVGGPIDFVQPAGGTLVPPEDSLALAVALRDILSDPGRAAALGRFNRSVAEGFDWRRVTDQLERVYLSVTAAGAARQRPALARRFPLRIHRARIDHS